MTESFEDAIKALRHIARGNGSVLRIADRIVAAHERETKVEGVCGPITGELRAAMHQWGWVESDGSITFATSPTPPSIDAEKSLTISGSDFTQLCDAIDSIHATLERENADLRMKFVNVNRHALHVERENAALKAELDRVLGEQDRDGWVELPKDADGEVIYAGDKLDGYGKTIEVVELRYGRSGWVLISRDGNAYADTYAFSHHHPDTWERIIEEVLQRGHDDYPLNVDTEPYVARCKKLAGDAE